MLILNSIGRTLNWYSMRTRIIYIALAILMLAGCVPETGFLGTTKDGIVLELYLVDPQTKATREGDNTLNENKISERIDIFFYDENTGEITKEILNVLRINNLVSIETNPTDIETIFGTLGAGAKRGLFVVANFTGTYSGTAGSRTITDIKNSLIPVSANNWWETLPQDSFVMTGEVQVTLGSAQGQIPVYAQVGLERVAAKVTFDVTVSENVEGGWIPVTNAMSVYMVYAMNKATLGAEPVAMPASASATYGAGTTVVYSQYVDKELYNTGTTRNRTRQTGASTTTVSLPVYSTDHDGSKPFYTYPCTWETGSSMEPYMKLIIPWKYGEHGSIRKYYYKIPFHGNELLRNHWYHISIDVQILGTEQADPPQVDIKYAIANWGGTMDTASAEEISSITSVPAAVITARYLNVPTTEYVLYNENELIIPIQTSHDIEIIGYDVVSNAYKSAHMVDENYIGYNPRIYNPFTTTLNSQGKIVAVRPDYSQITPSSVSHSFTYDQAADSEGWSMIVTGRESITFKHNLKNETTSGDYDVAPYTIRMRIRHQGDGADLYYTDVTIEQRPAIIIKPEANSGGTSNYGYGYVNGGQNTGQNVTDNGRYANPRYTSTDGSWTSSSNLNDYWTYYLGSSPSDLSNSSNKNTNMYVIETSVLPTTGSVANYVLGDPRSRTIDNLSGGNTPWSQSKASVQGGDRRISYYYPAGGAEYSNFIAPKFRIASSFGSTAPVTYDNAKRRCASYQEDGYPAGRWRLPTVAEITYMAQLTKDKLIPRLLGGDDSSNTDYWSNNGYVTVPGGTSTSSLSDNTDKTGTRYVRCVYDEWYWEDTTKEKVTKTTFTWGDQDRSTVRKNTHE